jgi:hypothetical protein
MMPSSSKTARRSTPKMGKSLTDADKVELASSSPIRRIIPLNDGRHCYLADPLTGANKHLATNSHEFISLVATLARLGLRDRLAAELSDFAARWPDSAWPEVYANLTADDGALTIPPDDTEAA